MAPLKLEVFLERATVALVDETATLCKLTMKSLSIQFEDDAERSTMKCRVLDLVVEDLGTEHTLYTEIVGLAERSDTVIEIKMVEEHHSARGRQIDIEMSPMRIVVVMDVLERILEYVDESVLGAIISETVGH